MSYIQSKVEEILYQYVGIAKPIKKEKLPSEALEIETDLLPTDLEQVSPDSDKKSLPDAMDMEESRGEEIEEEIVEDEEFESPAFEPIEAITAEKNENSNLSAISGLTSQDSLEEKNDVSLPEQQQLESQLSQISSVQDMSQEADSEAPPPLPPTEDVPIPEPPAETQEAPEEPVEKSNFDLKKDSIEFTGTERAPITLEDSQSNIEPEKVLQPQDVPSNTMEIDNLYENDTTDSSEARMEIDLKDETTQGTTESTKVEESSQDSTVSKDKSLTESKKESSRHHHHKSDRSRDDHKSSSHKSRHHHHRSSSSRSNRDDKHRKSDGKSSSSSHKKSSSEKDRSSSSRRDHDKKSSKDESSKSKPRDSKSDDHHQEKSSRKRRSTDHDSNEGKDDKSNIVTPSPISVDTKLESDKQVDSSTIVKSADEVQETTENKPVKVDKMLSENCEISFDSRSSTSSNATKKEPKSSILIKYDYLKSPPKLSKVEKIEDGFCGFAVESLPENPWFACLRKETEKKSTKKPIRGSPIPLEQKKSKAKPKPKQVDTASDDASKLQNGSDETSSEAKAQSIAQQQRYNTMDLYKPRFDFGNRSRRRGQATEETSDEAQGSKTEETLT